jgi:hypothetical protein
MELKTYYIVKIFTTSIEYLKCNQTNAKDNDIKCPSCVSTKLSFDWKRELTYRVHVVS